MYREHHYLQYIQGSQNNRNMTLGKIIIYLVELADYSIKFLSVKSP